MYPHQVSTSVVYERKAAVQHSMVVGEDEVAVDPLVLVAVLAIVHLLLEQFMKLNHLRC